MTGGRLASPRLRVAALAALSATGAVAWIAVGAWTAARADAVYRYWDRLNDLGSAGTDELDYQRRVSDLDAASVLAQATPWFAFASAACLVVLLAALAIRRRARAGGPAAPAP